MTSFFSISMLSRLVEIVHTNSTQGLNQNFVKQNRKALPDESCRNCGGSLTNCSLCAQCKEVIGMICVSCGTRALEQFHDSCLYMVEDFQTKSSLIQNEEFSPKMISIN